MTEPVAYRVDGKIYNNIIDAKFAVREIENFRNELGIDNGLIRTPKYLEPLYTAEQLHPRAKMTQAEFDEFKKLLSVDISTIYEALDVIDSDRGETNEFEQLYNRLFTNGVNEQVKQQNEFAKLWGSLLTYSAEETIEIVPDMKWFVRSKERNLEKNYYYFVGKRPKDNWPRYGYKRAAKKFDTKEEAEKWKNPDTEAVQLPVEE